MQNTFLISVVIPVYNSEKYLSACVDSVLNQTYQNFELLLIDDGSSDTSAKICDEYSKKDNRIIVYHQKNLGVTRARAHGVEKSTGLWISFVDSDDTLPVNSLELLYNGIKDNDVDIVMGASRDFGGRITIATSLSISGKIKSSDYIRSMLVGNCGMGVVCRLIRKSLFTKNVFYIPREVTNNEDLIMNIRLANNARFIRVYPGLIIYNYYYRIGSASKRKLSLEDWNRTFFYVKASLETQYYPFLKIYIIKTLYMTKHTILNYSSSEYYNFAIDNFPRRSFSRLYLFALKSNSSIVDFFIKYYNRCRFVKRLILFFFSKHKI